MGLKGGTPVASTGIERTDIFFQTTARLISINVSPTVIQESIGSEQLQNTCRGDSSRYVTETHNKKQMPRTKPRPLGTPEEIGLNDYL